MTLKETLQGFNDRLDTLTAELRDDFDRLNEKIANTPVAEDVSAELASLDSKISSLEGLDQPDPDEAGETVGAPVNPTPEPVPDVTTAESPGEPYTLDEDGNVVPEEG